MSEAASARRILHLIDTGGPGGAETVFLDVVAGLDPERWRSTVVVPERDWLYGALEARGIRPLVVRGQGSFDLGYVAALFRLIRSERVELIQTHLLGTAVYGGLVGRLARLPVVSTFHGTADLPPDERYRRIKLRILRRASQRLVFVSRALERWFVEVHGADPARCGVIHNGIDLEHFVPRLDDGFRRELGIPDEAVLVGAIGNIRAPKRYDLFLRAAALLRKRSDRYRFVVVGDGGNQLDRELRDLRDTLGLANSLSFTGFRSDVREVLDALDVFCLSSSFEGFSLSTLEAVASGVPVVATRCGGPEEIVEEGRSGRLVPPGSPDALADAIAAVVEREGSGGSSRIAHHRRGDLTRFSVGSMVRRYEELYEDLLAAREPLRP